MKISKRLKRVGDFVDANSYIIDVGCDHALLDIYLVKTKENVKAIASDINEKPLEFAKNNIKKYNLEDKIEVTLSNGIENIKEEVDTIVISGMGTSTIIDIIFKNKDKLKNIKKIIVSSNNDWYLLRKTFINNNFYIKEEEIIYENKKYYPIIVFEKGNKKYNNFELKYGPILLKEKNKIYKDYIKNEINKLTEINKKLKLKHITKKIKIKKEISKLKKI